MFGYPLPLVPEKWRKAAQGTVDLLKQESSVAAFGAINEKVKDKDEANQTVRGASLRELSSARPAPPADQGQNAAVNEELLKALAKANGGTTTAGTCNNSCHCAIA